MTTCRACWMKTLTPAMRDQVAAEPVTTPVFLCDEHQAAYDEVLSTMPMLPFQKRLLETTLPITLSTLSRKA
jgi:hypothetical protein